jgi:hypothetical protein
MLFIIKFLPLPFQLNEKIELAVTVLKATTTAAK